MAPPLLTNSQFTTHRPRQCVCGMCSNGGAGSMVSVDQHVAHPEGSHPFGPVTDIVKFVQDGVRPLWWFRGIDPSLLPPPPPGFGYFFLEIKHKLKSTSKEKLAADVADAVMLSLRKSFVNVPEMGTVLQTAVHQINPDGSFRTGRLWWHRYGLLCPLEAVLDVVEKFGQEPKLVKYTIIKTPEVATNGRRLTPKPDVTSAAAAPVTAAVASRIVPPRRQAAPPSEHRSSKPPAPPLSDGTGEAPARSVETEDSAANARSSAVPAVSTASTTPKRASTFNRLRVKRSLALIHARVAVTNSSGSGVSSVDEHPGSINPPLSSSSSPASATSGPILRVPAAPPSCIIPLPSPTISNLTPVPASTSDPLDTLVSHARNTGPDVDDAGPSAMMASQPTRSASTEGSSLHHVRRTPIDEDAVGRGGTVPAVERKARRKSSGAAVDRELVAVEKARQDAPVNPPSSSPMDNEVDGLVGLGLHLGGADLPLSPSLVPTATVPLKEKKKQPTVAGSSNNTMPRPALQTKSAESVHIPPPLTRKRASATPPVGHLDSKARFDGPPAQPAKPSRPTRPWEL